MRLRHCSFCAAPIRFVRTANGRYLPIDVTPCRLTGTVVLETGVARVLTGDELASARAEDDRDLLVPHFASCTRPRSPRRPPARRPTPEPAGQLELL